MSTEIDNRKLEAVYLTAKRLCAAAGGSLDHSDIRIGTKMPNIGSRSMVQEYLNALEVLKKVSVDRRRDDEGGWTLVVV